ncbi:MAG TPA: hypothetical protein V6C89_04475 [Drouetiella sp.]|jgi:hypothetical protein
MTQNLPHKRISTKTLIESQSVDLTKTCWVAKTLIDFEFPGLKPVHKKLSHKALAKTLTETETSSFCHSPDIAKISSQLKLPDSKLIRTRMAKTLLDFSIPNSILHSTVQQRAIPQSAPQRKIETRSRRGDFRAKTMLDRRAIAEMVEKFEMQKKERARLADATATRCPESHDSVEPYDCLDRSDSPDTALIDKELEDKISADFSASDADFQTDNNREDWFVPLLTVALILVTIALVTFLALPADSSSTLVISTDCHKA